MPANNEQYHATQPPAEQWWNDPSAQLVSDGVEYAQPASGNWWDEPSVVEFEVPSVPEKTVETPVITGPENPFHDSVSAVMTEVAALDLEGSAVLPGANVGLSSDAQAEKSARELTFAELASRAQGEKLHLSFDQADPRSVAKVTALLEELRAQAGIAAYKFGKNGGQEGKDATVYVGHKDKAKIIASALEAQLADVLRAPEGDVIETDEPITGHVMGRFDVSNVDPDFHQYGAKGFPLLSEDVRRAQLMQPGSVELAAFLDDAQSRAQMKLRERYGDFYAGKQTV